MLVQFFFIAVSNESIGESVTFKYARGMSTDLRGGFVVYSIFRRQYTSGQQ